MIAFIIRRILNMIPLLFIISIFTFFLIQIPPGDFFDTMQAEIATSGSSQDAATFNILRERYGLDEPFHVQYLRWVQGWPQGDFGWSMAWSAPVLPLVMDRMIYTILLGGFALIITICYALPVGIYSANHQYSLGDNFFSLVGFLGLSLPGFLLALFWLFLGALVFRIDVGGVMSPEFSEQPMSAAKLYDMWQHFWPAAVILGLASTAQMQRIMRSSMLDTMNQQFITTARAKGLKERTVVNRYGVRVAINPMISVLALEIPKIISSSALVGIVLSLPTTGPLFLRALQTQDMYLAGTFLLFMALLLMVSNLFADIALAWADPRIVYE
jgi:peptide/nickel transport system permease protein